jgi:hypothetical protein
MDMDQIKINSKVTNMQAPISNLLLSIFSLTINQKEKTDKIYNSKYKVTEPFHIPPKETYDKTDWNFRKFKKYDEFTKTFDKTNSVDR